MLSVPNTLLIDILNGLRVDYKIYYIKYKMMANNGKTCLCNRSYKIIEFAEDGSSLKLWISNALDFSNNALWSLASLLAQVSDVASLPPVSLIGCEDEKLVRKIYNKWQAETIKHLIDINSYEAVFTHLHNVDCAGHQFWHLARNLLE